MLGRIDDPQWFDPDDAGDKLAAFVGMIAKAECHFASPYQITDLLAGRGPQIELDRNRTLSELAQHVDDVGVREGTDQRQRPQAHQSTAKVHRDLPGRNVLRLPMPRT